VIHAVDKISFGLNGSEFLGIAGESGSGKSVTALSIMKLIPVGPESLTEGHIWLHEGAQKIDLCTASERFMRKIRGKRISIVFQEPMTSLNPVHRCGDQVRELLLCHYSISKKEASSKVLRLFQEVRIPRPEVIYHAYPHQLSGGQRQRIMIAMAIACDPAVLIADEPTTALDVTIQKSIMELLKRLQESRKMSILFITHDIGLIGTYADRVIMMFRGGIVEQGPLSEVLQNPIHSYTKGLLACRPRIDIKVKRLITLQESSEEIQMPVHESSIKEFEDQPIIEAILVSKSFPIPSDKIFRKHTLIPALKPVTIEVFRGETLGIVGESGSGKTTLGRVLLKLVPPTSGEIHYKGQNITQLPPEKVRKLRKRMQIIFQDPYLSLNPRMIIGKALLEPMKIHRLHQSDRQRYKKVIEILGHVGLEPESYYRYPHEFSGGQRQRICIARALAVEPELIICDECVSSLDVSIQAQVLNLLNDLKQKYNLTYIFISHDLAVVRHMSDRLIVLKEGAIVEEGLAEDIYKNPATEYTRILIEAIPRITLHM
jgi:peptide/nickel transport system ATP-binding protein